MIDLDAIRANATDSKRRIGEMCANLRPPKMSIPVSPNDDDEFICRTMDDLLAYVDELLAERALIVQRAENAEAALEHVTELYTQACEQRDDADALLMDIAEMRVPVLPSRFMDESMAEAARAHLARKQP
jgi:hypothetical protein